MNAAALRLQRAGAYLLSGLALAAGVCASPAGAQTAARLDPLIVVPGVRDTACTADRAWCLSAPADEEGARVLGIHAGLPRPGSRPRATFRTEDSDGISFAGWDRIIRLPDKSIAFGIEKVNRNAYAGGSGMGILLTLYHLKPGAATPAEIVTLPLAGTISIRACFNTRDSRRRRNSCEDRYHFRSTLSPAATPRSIGDVLILETKATRFPRTARRGEDSTTAPALRPADLTWGTDARCSYRRRLQYDSVHHSWRLDQPLPDCDDYTSP